MSQLRQAWTFDETLNFWVFGTSENGGGVGTSDGLWFGNVVVQDQVTMIGKYETKEEAMTEVEEAFDRFISRN